MQDRIWENPEILGIGKLPYRSASWPAARENLKQELLHGVDDWRICLNGTWRVRKYGEPDEVPEDLFSAIPDRAWQELELPCNFETAGLAKPVYSNQPYPFKVDPPRVMGEPPEDWVYYKERNPTYCCRREFTLPSEWRDRKIRLHLGAVQSAVFVYLDGKEIGYSQNSMSPAEFDLTPFVTDDSAGGKPHILGLKVLTLCDGSYLEDQDFWRFSGVFRDVFLYSLSPVHLEHVQIIPHLDETTITEDPSGRQKGSGSFVIKADVCHEGDHQADLSLTVSLSPPASSPEPEMTSVCNDFSLKPGENRTISLEIPVEQIETWHSENPALCTVKAILARRDIHEILDIRFFRTGLKSTRIEKGVLLHNGRAIKLKGVNRHEHHETRGRAVRLEDMEEDIRLMLLGNINSVRCSHYPAHPLWYELCDRHGIMVMDEANMETHEISYHKRNLPGDRPEWKEASLDRARSMTLTNINSPSVIIRSLGNEAGYGTNFEAMAGLIRELAPGSLIHYADMNLPADFDSQTYPSPEWLEEYIAGRAERKGEQGQTSHEEQHGPQPTGKPFIMNEYAHAMGNSLGDAFKYWDIIYEHPRLTGGYIWEWCEHGLLQKRPDEREYYAYGGDFGDKPNDGNFCIDGMVSAGRRPNPSFWEAAHFHRYVDFKLIGGRLLVTNRFFFTSLAGFPVTWKLLEDGRAVKEGEFSAAAGPGETEIIDISTIDMSIVDMLTDSHSEYTLFLTCPDPALSGRCLGKAALALNYEEDSLYSWKGRRNTLFFQAAAHSGTAGTKLWEEKNSFILASRETKLVVSRETGFITGFTYRNRDIITSPLKIGLWRDPVDNDLGWKMPGECSFWKQTAETLAPEEVSIAGKNITTILANPAHDAVCLLSYSLNEEGSLQLSFSLKADSSLPSIPRIGLTSTVPKPEKEVKWYGRGPYENYADRKSSALAGYYSLPPEELPFPYVRPQENGQRSDLRFLILPGTGTDRSRITWDRRFSFSLRPYGDRDLESADHSWELPKSADDWQLHLDTAHMGVGGDNSWGARIHGEYIMPSGEYRGKLIWAPEGD